jgi:hypothetical protein
MGKELKTRFDGALSGDEPRVTKLAIGVRGRKLAVRKLRKAVSNRALVRTMWKSEEV